MVMIEEELTEAGDQGNDLCCAGLVCSVSPPSQVPLHTRLTCNNLSWSCFKGQVLCHYWLSHRQHPLPDWINWEEGALGQERL